jgi:hypothetical protein
LNFRTLSTRSNSSHGDLRFLTYIGPIALFVGSMVLWQLVLQPLHQLWRAQFWVSAECTITKSEAERKQFSKSSNYRPSITYRYLANNAEQVSERYDFFEASGNINWAQRIAAAYPVGTRQPCYYDPARPHEAVLVREVSDSWFWIRPLVAVVFMTAGVLMLRAGLASTRAKKSATEAGANPPVAISPNDRQPSNELQNLANQSARQPANPGLSTADGDSVQGGNARTDLVIVPTPYPERYNWQPFAGPQQLAPTITRTGAVLGTGFAALFWNGLISFFVWGIIDDQAWFMLLFLTPFILVGLGLIGGFFYTLLALFNPRVQIALSEGAPETGETIDIAWEVLGRTSRIREFQITAIGEEQATYTRGTDTVTEKHPFQTLEICRLTNPEEIRFGTATLQIPFDAMHSHSGNRNKISWSLKVHGKIPLFPDIWEQYEFRVLPRGVR